MKKKVAVIFGTRPEVIKLAPVIFELRQSELIEPYPIFSGQHEEMGQQMLETFKLKPAETISINRIHPKNSLNILFSQLVEKLDKILLAHEFIGTIVQGDTTTALAGALSSFHLDIPIAHVEAGLRTGNLKAPFPEEMNRSVITRITDIHLAPTKTAEINLRKEGVSGEVAVVGNSGIDALSWMNRRIENGKTSINPAVKTFTAGEYYLVTAHRRENFGKGLISLCEVLKLLPHPVVFPVHPNSEVESTVNKHLSGLSHVKLIPPVDYPSLLFLLKNCRSVITDSGGIQEEAPTFSKKVFVTRRSTERDELIECGGGELLDLSNPSAALLKLEDCTIPAKLVNPFGDGKTSERIRRILELRWSDRS